MEEKVHFQAGKHTLRSLPFRTRLFPFCQGTTADPVRASWPRLQGVLRNFLTIWHVCRSAYEQRWILHDRKPREERIFVEPGSDVKIRCPERTTRGAIVRPVVPRATIPSRQIMTVPASHTGGGAVPHKTRCAHRLRKFQRRQPLYSEL